MKLLLDWEVTIDAEDRGGGTPLHRATGSGYKAVVKLLLDREATINTKD